MSSSGNGWLESPAHASLCASHPIYLLDTRVLRPLPEKIHYWKLSFCEKKREHNPFGEVQTSTNGEVALPSLRDLPVGEAGGLSQDGKPDEADSQRDHFPQQSA